MFSHANNFSLDGSVLCCEYKSRCKGQYTDCGVHFHPPFSHPGGEDIEPGPGVYQVEAAESWLKLVPRTYNRGDLERSQLW